MIACLGADELDEFIGVGEFAGLGGARRQIATQGDDAADAGRLILVENIADVGARRTDAGKVWRGIEAFGGDFLDDREGALARRAAGTKGDGEEFRLENR